MTFKRKVAYVANSEEIQDGMSGYRFRVLPRLSLSVRILEARVMVARKAR